MKKHSTLLLLCLSTAFYLQAQQDFREYYSDQVDDNEVLLSASAQSISVKVGKGKFLKKIFYPEKKAMTHYITYKDKGLTIRDGLYREWYDDGKLWQEGAYKNDERQGPWYYFDYLGSKESRGNYQNDLKEGKWETRDSLGRPAFEEMFVAGKLDGETKHFDQNGELTTVQLYIKGVLVFEKRMDQRSDAVVSEAIPILKACENLEIEKQMDCTDAKLWESMYKQIKYPASARMDEIQGEAVIFFVIEKDGSISNIRALRGVCADIEAECLRVVRNLPEWVPGKKNGEAVRVAYKLPIKFRLE